MGIAVTQSLGGRVFITVPLTTQGMNIAIPLAVCGTLPLFRDGWCCVHTCVYWTVEASLHLVLSRKVGKGRGRGWGDGEKERGREREIMQPI